MRKVVIAGSRGDDGLDYYNSNDLVKNIQARVLRGESDHDNGVKLNQCPYKVRQAREAWERGWKLGASHT